MPEINNTVKTEPQFSIPAREKTKLVNIIWPIITLVFFAVGWFGHGYLLPSVIQVPNEQVIPEKTEETVSAIDSYYLTSNPSDTTINLYGHNKGSSFPDTKIASFKSPAISVLGKYIEPNTYLVNLNVSPGKMEVLNAETGKIETLLEVDPSGYFRAVAISEDKKWLAYGITTEGQPNSSEIWLYNLETKQKKVLVPKTEQKIYQGYAILGWRNDDQELIVSALGGDAGAIWGDVYQVNVTSGTMTKVTPVPDSAMHNFLRGKLSPDGNSWLYQYCQTPTKENAQNSTETDGFGGVGCDSGAELRTYNFATKKTSSVYHNNRYSDNTKKSSLQTIIDFIWQDDSNVLAVVPGAIIKLSVGSSETSEKVLYEFDSINPMEYQHNPINLISASTGQVVFSHNEGIEILDLVSQKIEHLILNGTKESFSDWLSK